MTARLSTLMWMRLIEKLGRRWTTRMTMGRGMPKVRWFRGGLFVYVAHILVTDELRKLLNDLEEEQDSQGQGADGIAGGSSIKLAGSTIGMKAAASQPLRSEGSQASAAGQSSSSQVRKDVKPKDVSLFNGQIQGRPFSHSFLTGHETVAAIPTRSDAQAIDQHRALPYLELQSVHLHQRH